MGNHPEMDDGLIITVVIKTRWHLGQPFDAYSPGMCLRRLGVASISALMVPQ